MPALLDPSSALDGLDDIVSSHAPDPLDGLDAIVQHNPDSIFGAVAHYTGDPSWLEWGKHNGIQARKKLDEIQARLNAPVAEADAAAASTQRWDSTLGAARGIANAGTFGATGLTESLTGEDFRPETQRGNEWQTLTGLATGAVPLIASGGLAAPAVAAQAPSLLRSAGTAAGIGAAQSIAPAAEEVIRGEATIPQAAWNATKGAAQGAAIGLGIHGATKGIGWLAGKAAARFPSGKQLNQELDSVLSGQTPDAAPIDTPTIEQPSRQPWQMTRSEWAKSDFDQQVAAQSGKRKMNISQDSSAHKQAVESALQQGLPVPPEVVRDYPDLIEKYIKLNAVSQHGSPIEQPAATAIEPQRVTPAPAPTGDNPLYVNGRGYDIDNPTFKEFTRAGLSKEFDAQRINWPDGETRQIGEFYVTKGTDKAGRAVMSNITKQPAANVATAEPTPLTEPIPNGKTQAQKGQEDVLTAPKPSPSAPEPPAAAGEAIPPITGGYREEGPSRFPPDTTSLRNAHVAEKRDAMGMPEQTKPTPHTHEAAKQEAIQQGIPERAEEIAAETLASNKAMSDTHAAGMDVRLRQIENELGTLNKQLETATDPADIKTTATAIDRLEKSYELITDATKASGTETGRALNIRRLTLNENFEPVAVKMRAKAAKGADLTLAENAQFAEMANKIKVADERYTELASKLDSTQKSLDELRNRPKKLTIPKDPKWLASLSKSSESAKVRLREKLGGGTLRAGLDPTILSDIAIIGAEKIARGAVNVAQFTKALADDLGEHWENLKTHIDEIHSESVKFLENASTQEQKAIGRSIALNEQRVIELTGHLEAGTLPEPKPRKMLSSPDLDAIRQQRKELEAQLRGSDIAQKRRIQKSIAAIDQQLQGEVKAKPKGQNWEAMSKEVQRLDYERFVARRKLQDKINALKPKSLWDKATEPFNATRAIMTSFDLSAVLRQGSFISLAHPVRAARSIVPMLRAFASDEGGFRVAKEIEGRANAPLYKKAGLYLARSDSSASLGQMEEAFMSRWVQKVPLVKGSERAYTTFLNKLRADSFDAMSRSLSQDGNVTLAEAKAISNFINVATGRGTLPGAMEHAAKGLNTVFFAPRYVASRFEILSGQPLWKGSAATRKAIATEYARYLGGLAVVYTIGAAAGGAITGDPRSSDFGKMRWGTTRLDPLSGLSQVSALVSKLVSGQKKNIKGDVVPIRGSKVPFGGQNSFDTMATFTRSKLAPAPGAAVNLLTGKDVVGQPSSPLQVAGNLVTPISASDLMAALKAQGIVGGTALGILSLLGMGVQDYSKPNKPSRYGQ